MFALLVTFGLSAQSWTDRWTDDSYLPEEGDWAIGFDATSSLNYFGNLLNSGASAPTADFVSGEDDRFDQTIYGKLMTSESTALRARLGIRMDKDVDRTNVDEIDGDAGDMVEDKYTEGNTDIKLWLGKEYRRGSTRLQGVYGAEAGLMLASKTEKWEYGNSAEDRGANASPLETKGGATIGFGLRAFIGFEYFMMPKISIGGEYGWGLLYKSVGGGSTKTETYDAADDDVDEDVSNGANDSYMGFDNDNATGSLVLKMYF